MDICKWLSKKKNTALSDAEWRKPFLDVMGYREHLYRVQAASAHCRRNPFVSEIRGFLTGSIWLKEVCTQEKATCDLLEVT